MNRLILLGVLLIVFMAPSASAQLMRQKVAGAGPSTEVVKHFFQHFSRRPEAAGYQFVVPDRSAKHAGGIKASSTYLFGRTGRPLNQKEQAMNKGEIFLARIPIVFATGAGTGVSQLNMAQIEGLYTGKISDWSMLGGEAGAVVLGGREPTEALLGVLKQHYPFFGQIGFDYVLKKDHQVISFLKHREGWQAISFGAGPNFNGLNVLEVSDFSIGVNVGLVYDLGNRDHPLVVAVRRYAASPEWAQQLQALQLLPPGGD